MCGRFSATFSFREIKLRWNLQGDFSFEPRYNIAPSQEVPVILRGESGNVVRLMRWGLVPFWAQDESISSGMINARVETLAEKPSFRRLVKNKRCVIPADGFYEWRREGNRKVPVWIHLKSREPFSFAGLWDVWQDRVTDNALHTFAIITCRSNALLRPIHNRMPVIYDDALARQWLDDPTFGWSSHFLPAVLRPYPSELMTAYDVSTLVNSPTSDRPECIEPLPPGYVHRGQLPLV
jgi:putative SOS response-associated peptidase YedK